MWEDVVIWLKGDGSCGFDWVLIDCDEFLWSIL